MLHFANTQFADIENAYICGFYTAKDCANMVLDIVTEKSQNATVLTIAILRSIFFYRYYDIGNEINNIIYGFRF